MLHKTAILALFFQLSVQPRNLETFQDSVSAGQHHSSDRHGSLGVCSTPQNSFQCSTTQAQHRTGLPPSTPPPTATPHNCSTTTAQHATTPDRTLGQHNKLFHPQEQPLQAPACLPVCMSPPPATLQLLHCSMHRLLQQQQTLPSRHAPRCLPAPLPAPAPAPNELLQF
jgi:hypothetical protein